LLLPENPTITGSPPAGYQINAFGFPLGLDDNLGAFMLLRKPRRLSHDRPGKHHLAALGQEQAALRSHQLEELWEIGLVRKLAVRLRAPLAPVVISRSGVVLQPVKGVTLAAFIHRRFAKEFLLVRP